MFINSKKTYTTVFLVPVLKINKDYLKRFNFINAYLRDKDHETQYENCLHLVFKPNDLKEFEKFVESEKKRVKELFVEDYDCGYGYVVLVYKIPKQFLGDFKLIMQGKYSKLSKEFIDLFPETKTSLDEDGFQKVTHSLHFHIFNKTQALKNWWEDKLGIELENDSEYWSIPNVEKETFNLDVFIKEEQNESNIANQEL